MDMCVDMCIHTFTDMRVDTCMDMCVEISMDMHPDVDIGMCYRDANASMISLPSLPGSVDGAAEHSDR